jgi:hypothetical protein
VNDAASGGLTFIKTNHTSAGQRMLAGRFPARCRRWFDSP